MKKLLRTLSVLLMAALFAPMNMQAETSLSMFPLFESTNLSKPYFTQLTRSSNNLPETNPVAPIYVTGEIASGYLFLDIYTYPNIWPCPINLRFTVIGNNGSLSNTAHFYWPKEDGSIDNSVSGSKSLLIGNIQEFEYISTIYVQIIPDDWNYSDHFYNAISSLDSNLWQLLKKMNLLRNGQIQYSKSVVREFSF